MINDATPSVTARNVTWSREWLLRKTRVEDRLLLTLNKEKKEWLTFERTQASRELGVMLELLEQRTSIISYDGKHEFKLSHGVPFQLTANSEAVENLTDLPVTRTTSLTDKAEIRGCHKEIQKDVKDVRLKGIPHLGNARVCSGSWVHLSTGESARVTTTTSPLRRGAGKSYIEQ